MTALVDNGFALNAEDAGGWAPALDHCPHIDQAIVFPSNGRFAADLSRNIE